MISKKIVLVGDFSTGKTSLIRRFVDNEFSDKYLTTIGVKISRKNVIIGDIEVQNIIWDIEGATESKMINPSYLLGAHGAIVVADVSRQPTIDHIQSHIETIYKASKGIPVAIALNKSDLLSEDEGMILVQNLQEKLDSSYSIRLTSDKTAYGVEEIFQELSKLMVK